MSHNSKLDAGILSTVNDPATEKMMGESNLDLEHSEGPCYRENDR